MTESGAGWRQQKKNATRDRIRSSALRLFQEHGYEATTVEQISAAAGVSHMTFFRYFPSKEDVALSDSFDPLICSLLEQTPQDQPLMQRIRTALEQGLEQMYSANRDALLAQNDLIVSTPALRDRLWSDQVATQEVILRALSGGQDDVHHSVQTRVTVATCLSAASMAVLMWVENGGTPELPELLEQAFDALTNLASAPSPEPSASPAPSVDVQENLHQHQADDRQHEGDMHDQGLAKETQHREDQARTRGHHGPGGERNHLVGRK